jgi:23S rRNA (pseudouridine1915-N3)-methyltransferase
MKIIITAIGRIKDDSVKSLIAEYVKRLPWTIKIIEIEASTKSKNPEVLKLEEEKSILAKMPDGYFKIALDETGSLLSSEDFARTLAKISTNQTGNIAFIIGGSDGLSENIRKSANLTISLGKMTYPHMLARLLLVEQLYRSYMIIEGKTYHKFL